MLRNCLCLTYVLCYLFIHHSVGASQLMVDVQADAAILINADSGKVLFEKDANTPHYPASITKVATALFALHSQGHKLETLIPVKQEAVGWISQNEKKRSNYTIPSYWLEPGSSHANLKKGEEITLLDLLYGMLIVSGNDAANAITQYIGGSIPNCMKHINAYLKDIGCQNTYFINPHGLFHPKHMTSCFDMALITKEAMKDPVFRKIVQTLRYQKPKTHLQDSITWVQTNRLLKKGPFYYPKAVGVKTGYTEQASYTLIAAAEDGDRMLIAVLLKGRDRDSNYSDAIRLFDAAFAEKKVEKVILPAGPQKYKLNIPDVFLPIQTSISKDITVTYYPSEEPLLEGIVQWDRVSLPIQRNQKIGQVIFNKDGNEWLNVPLFAMKGVSQSSNRIWKLMGLTLLIGSGFVVIRRLRR